MASSSFLWHAPRIIAGGFFTLLTIFGAMPLDAGPITETPPPPPPFEEPGPDLQGRFETQIENDLWGGSDKNYTNGARFTYYGSRGAGSPYFDQTSLSLTQLIFTPDDIETSEPLPDERPYAGWLALGLSGYRYSNNDAVLCLFSIEVGTTGEPSLAEQVQKLYHDISDIEPPRGWANQLDAEPGLILSYERRQRVLDRNTGVGWGYSGIVHGGLSLGNIITHAKIGGQLRAGYNMTPRFGYSTLQPGVGGHLPATAPARGVWSVYGFLGVEGRAVARNIFLDGNTFSDSMSVDKNILVGDAFIGIGARWNNVEVAFTETLRSKEFKDQQDPQPFGALTLTWHF